MMNYEIAVGNTIVTKPNASGESVTGQVLSKGPKYCTVLDKLSKRSMRVPYSLIIASDNKRAELDIPQATAGQTVVGPKGEKFRIVKVNSANYVATSLTNGITYRLPKGCVTEVLDGRSEQKAFLASKGLSESEIDAFFALAA